LSGLKGFKLFLCLTDTLSEKPVLLFQKLGVRRIQFEKALDIFQLFLSGANFRIDFL
jgi:hypothetical protein